MDDEVGKGGVVMRLVRVLWVVSFVTVVLVKKLTGNKRSLRLVRVVLVVKLRWD